MQDRLEAIGRRWADPRLRLAVVGEFSSGKSSFVNALLGESLLKAGSLVTTAVPTVLRGGSPDIECRFRNDALWLSRARHAPALAARLADVLGGEPLPQAPVPLLRLLVADERVATRVDRVRVRRSAPLLDEDVDVIDTPGLNSQLPQHAEATRRIVADEADACVVIVPSGTPVSQTLGDFLTTELQPYLHRCMFVVTKLAHIDPEEREELVAFVEQRLRERLGLPHATVLACSLAPVIASFAGGAADDEAAEWVARFRDLEARLAERIRRERTATTCETVIRLLDALVDEMRAAVGAGERRHAERSIGELERCLRVLAVARRRLHPEEEVMRG